MRERSIKGPSARGHRIPCVLLALGLGLAACGDGGGEPAATAAPKDASACAMATPLISPLAAGLQALQAVEDSGGDPVERALDDLSDTLIDAHDRLDGGDWDDLAEWSREAIAEVGGLPLGNGADSQLERLRWTITPASVHDQIISRCQEPARTEARNDAHERRDNFLNSGT